MPDDRTGGNRGRRERMRGDSAVKGRFARECGRDTAVSGEASLASQSDSLRRWANTVLFRSSRCAGGFRDARPHGARRQVTRGAKAVVDEAQSSVHGARASRGGHTGRAIVFLMAYAGTASLPSHGEVSPRARLTRRGSRGRSRAADGRESARLAQGDWSRWRDLHADGTSLTGRSPVATSECVGVPRVPRLRYIVHDQERRCTDDWWLPGVDQLILQLRIANEECLSTVAPTD